MTRAFKLQLSPELEKLRTSKAGARKRHAATSPRVKLSAPPTQSESEPQSAPQALSDPLAHLNSIGGVFWTPAQDAAFTAGASWDEVEAMEPKPQPGALERPFVRPQA